MTNKPLTLALAAAALLTMAGGRANAAAQTFPTPATPPGTFFPNPGTCPASITIAQIFSPSRTVVPPALPTNSPLRYGNNAQGVAVPNAERTGIGLANNISSSGKASTYQCILGNKLIGPWYFPTSSTTAVPNDSSVLFRRIGGAEAISFIGEGGEFAVGEKVEAPIYRIQILSSALGGTGFGTTSPGATFTGASSIVAVNCAPNSMGGCTNFLPTDFSGAGVKVEAETRPGGVGGASTTFDLNAQGAVTYINGNLRDPTAETIAGNAGCTNSGPTSYKPVGAPSGTGMGAIPCGGKFLNAVSSLNTGVFNPNPTPGYGSGLWVATESSPGRATEVVSMTTFWCESVAGCAATHAPGVLDELPELEVPEPASLSLLLLGLAGLGFERWRSRHGSGGRIRVNKI